MSADNITVSDLEVMTVARNYRQWMFRLLAPFIGQRILEVGAGIGNFTELLLDHELVVPVDKYRPCIELLEERFGQRLGMRAVEMDIADPKVRSLAHYAFDTVVCLNVLEHIGDDVGALANMHALLRPSGRLVLLVPAFQFLYGSIDRSLEHCRRYTRKDLLPRMRQAGFIVERSFYMNLIGMAGWFWNNRILRRPEESARQIALFDRLIAPWAERMEMWWQPPVGLSLIAIGVKQGSGSDE